MPSLRRAWHWAFGHRWEHRSVAEDDGWARGENWCACGAIAGVRWHRPDGSAWGIVSRLAVDYVCEHGRAVDDSDDEPRAQVSRRDDG